MSEYPYLEQTEHMYTTNCCAMFRSPSPDVEESLCFGLRKRVVRKSRPRSPIVVTPPRRVLEKVPNFKTSTSVPPTPLTRQQAGGLYSVHRLYGSHHVDQLSISFSGPTFKEFFRLGIL